MDELLASLIFPIILLVIVLITKWNECNKLKKTKELTAWTVTITDRYRCFDLFTYISRAQKDLELSQPYCIDSNEIEFAKEILNALQQNTAQLYFYDTLPKPKCKSISSCEAYFMFLLHCYLKKIQCADSFLGHNMQNKTISKTDYGSWGVTQYEATNEISDFALVVNKLIYVSLIYLRKSKDFNYLNNEYWINDEQKSLEKIIFTKVIHISQMC